MFHRAQVFNFKKDQLNQFCLSWIVFLVLYLKIHYQTQGHIDQILSYVFSRNFIVVHFIGMSMIHFELIFVKDVQSMSGFFFFSYGCSILLAPLIEKTILSPLNCLCAFGMYQLITLVLVCFWALCFIPLVYMSIILPVPHCLNYSILKSSRIKSCNFILFLQYCMDLCLSI